MSASQTLASVAIEASLLSLETLAEKSGFKVADLKEMMEYGALLPDSSGPSESSFSADWVEPLRAVSRLRADFDLDLFTVAMVLGYLHRISTLEKRVQHLSEQLDASQPGAVSHFT